MSWGRLPTDAHSIEAALSGGLHLRLGPSPHTVTCPRSMAAVRSRYLSARSLAHYCRSALRPPFNAGAESAPRHNAPKPRASEAVNSLFMLIISCHHLLSAIARSLSSSLPLFSYRQPSRSALPPAAPGLACKSNLQEDGFSSLQPWLVSSENVAPQSAIGARYQPSS
ncbi:hypothetical protein ONS95_014870 [Cadophora gregata]|uniref:uncharacterized protein n=1 Tax=Cadophora gregata TaxID=51156 RepID=UPI0026DCFB3C|nr:uncharacterized protein ONS95_014870 [Cadophora gregata]KAK0113171.1 hypothetical protein ONS95_014870 [Cadophora gregata]KAK0125213.1 hypothetical protein ONS96_009071 [Cadophora gregata f. sp. sojae]